MIKRPKCQHSKLMLEEGLKLRYFTSNLNLTVKKTDKEGKIVVTNTEYSLSNCELNLNNTVMLTADVTM